MIEMDLLGDLPSVRKKRGNWPSGPLGISTDSRSYGAGEMFVAMDGPNFKALQFVESVLKKNCPVVVFGDQEENWTFLEPFLKTYPGVTFVGVSDALLFFQELGSAHLKAWREKKGKNRKVISITGSNGKTTSKELLFQFLQVLGKEKVLCTEKNFNNHIGVPKTLVRLVDTVDVAVVEIGTNHPGEIPFLCDLIHPQSGIITNIGPAHLEFFGNEENVFLEKRALYDSVRTETGGAGHFVTSGDDPYLRTLPPSPGLVFVKASAGEGGKKTDDQTALLTFGPQWVEVSFRGKTYRLTNQFLTGKHNFRNLATTFLLALLHFPHKEKELVQIAPELKPVENRSKWIRTGAKSFFLDAYNANPGSMKEALRAFSEQLQENGVAVNRQFYILGDMNELGQHSRHYHIEIGKFLKDLGGVNVAFIGRFGSYYQEGLGGHGLISLDCKEFKEKFWTGVQEEYDYFFIKGSRSLKLETLLGPGPDKGN